MKSITQDIRYYQAILSYADKHGVTKAAIKYRTYRQFIYRLRNRYDATHTFFSFEDFKVQLARRNREYNNFPMRPLEWKSPREALSLFLSCVTYDCQQIFG